MYQAILFAPDGEFVTDFKRETKQEVEDCINGMGSRWIFYPIVAIIKADVATKTSNKRLDIEEAGWLDIFNNKAVKTLVKFLQVPENQKAVIELFEN